jgi:hypothetical protein
VRDLEQLILKALGRAAAEGEAVPLFGTRSTPGLFQTTAGGKQAAQRACDEGYLCLAEPPHPPATQAVIERSALVKTRAVPPRCAITDKGLAYLLDQSSPRQVLEDFVRVLEARGQQVQQLADTARQTQARLEALREHAARVLDCVARSTLNPGSLNARCRDFHQQPAPLLDSGSILDHLAAWHASGAPEDYPLPELFRQLAVSNPGLSIGQFHDTLRKLHDAGQLYLHPWTGPLYELPEPPYALLIGHEIAYYASVRN